MRDAGSLQNAGKAGYDAGAATGNRGTIVTIPNIADAEFSGAAAQGGQSGAADQRGQLSAEDLISEAEFTAAAGVVAEIETASGTLVAENSDASLAGEFVARIFGSEGIGRDKKMGVAQGLVKLAGSQVAGAEQEVITPLSVVM